MGDLFQGVCYIKKLEHHHNIEEEGPLPLLLNVLQTLVHFKIANFNLIHAPGAVAPGGQCESLSSISPQNICYCANTRTLQICGEGYYR